MEKEYKIITWRGILGLDKKEWYTKANSAQELQEKIETELAFEISEGMKYKIESFSPSPLTL